MNKFTARVSGLVFCTLMFLTITVQAAPADDEALQQAITISQKLATAPLLDREEVLRGSKVSLAKLSPDGKRIAFVKKEGKERTRLASFWLYDIAGDSFRKLFTFRNVSDLVWSSGSNSIFLEVPEGVAVSRLDEDSTPYLLKKLDPELKEKWISVETVFEESVLVQTWDRRKREFVTQRVTVAGDTTEVYRTHEDQINFSTDFDGKASLALGLNRAADSQGEKLIYDLSGDVKQVIWTCQWDDFCNAFYHDKQNHRLLLRTNQDADLLRLAWADLKTKVLTTVHLDPESVSDVQLVTFAVDVASKGFSPQVFAYHGDQRRRYGSTKEIQQHIDVIEKALDSEYLVIKPPVLQDIHQTRWFIHDRSPNKRVTRYYLYDPVTGTVSSPLRDFIDEANADIKLIDDAHIAPIYPVHYNTTDGFSLQGYLTLPPGVDLAKAPMVVKVHGGPFNRVKNNYDSFTQILANRGYIVFQPNFRASTGFGKAYKTSVLRDFGDGRIQQDIIDGVQYLLAQGLGDKNRLAIVGHSFGGFSVLGGLAFTPDLFQVGFAGAPPHDMGRSVKFYKRFMKKQRQEMDEYVFKISIVDWTDEEAVAENTRKSPGANAHKITKPLVIWAGKNDGRVFVVDVKDYALRIEEMEKQVTLFVDPKAKHSPSTKVGSLAYQYLLEKTLADHIGGQLQVLDPEKDMKLIRFLRKNMVMDYNKMTPNSP